jgi:hypothetical protein
MDGAQLRAALVALRWSQRGLAAELARDPSTVRQWIDDLVRIPPDVAAWLRILVACHAANPAPRPARRRPARS